MNKLTFARPIYLAILLILVALLVAGPALAQNSTATGTNELSASPHPQGGGPTDPAELEAFLDEFMADQMEEYHTAGASFAVVKDGELFFTKGYGYADLENRIPVDPERTLFGVGSSSKTFVWTAVMQLAEQGKVDLNADVNTYLKKDVQIPATFPEPITLRHLLTHTSGFEDVVRGIFPLEIESVPPLEVYIREDRPARVRPPGTTLGYSNYGAALAAYIVQEVSGVPFEQYVEDNIFDPLGMARSTFRQPLPPGLSDDRAVGYIYGGGEYRPHLEWVRPAPAGGMMTTAPDMARFMIAHLQDGRFEGERILQEATAQEMHSLQFSRHPQASGWTYGFIHTVVNGERIIWHKGSTFAFVSDMILLPDRDIGLYVAYNNMPPPGYRELMEVFVDHYYPAPPAPAVPLSITDSDADLDRFVGSYRATRLNETGLESFMALAKPVSVKSTSNGTLQTVFVGFFPEQVLQRAATKDPLVFSQIDGRDTLVFLEDTDGNTTDFVVESFPIEEYYRLGWFETSTFQLLWLLVCLIFLLVNVFFWPVWFLKHKRAAREGVSPTTRLAIWVSWGVAALGLVFMIGFMITFGGPQLVEGLPPAGLLLIPLIMTVLTIAMVILAIVTWLRREWSLGMRIYYALVTVASVAFIWWLYNWNLLGWPF